MGNIGSFDRVNFEFVQQVIQGDTITNTSNNAILLNTLPDTEQSCIIQGSVIAAKEEEIVNNLIRRDKKKLIIVYGRNHSDLTVYKKYNQLKNLGLSNVKIYVGGMFEWLCLQDIYGKELFKTSSYETDILRYK